MNYLLFGKKTAGEDIPRWWGNEGAGDETRAAWTATANLPSPDLNTALRTMHATRKLTRVLKDRAGLPGSGRPVRSPYEHACLSWPKPYIPTKA